MMKATEMLDKIEAIESLLEELKKGCEDSSEMGKKSEKGEDVDMSAFEEYEE